MDFVGVYGAASPLLIRFFQLAHLGGHLDADMDFFRVPSDDLQLDVLGLSPVSHCVDLVAKLAKNLERNEQVRQYPNPILDLVRSQNYDESQWCRKIKVPSFNFETSIFGGKPTRSFDSRRPAT